MTHRVPVCLFLNTAVVCARLAVGVTVAFLTSISAVGETFPKLLPPTLQVLMLRSINFTRREAVTAAFQLPPIGGLYPITVGAFALERQCLA